MAGKASKSEIDVTRPAAEVARDVLSRRLALMEHYLPLAARRADEDIEYVHQLRVSSRRALAAVEMFAPLMSPKRAQRMIRLLKEVRNCAGAARDLDVLALRTLKRHDNKRRLAILKKRVAAQAPIVAMHKRFKGKDGLARSLDADLLAIGTGKRAAAGTLSFRDWADRALAEAAGAFFAVSTRDTDCPEKLHRMRIRGKQLRYTLELVADVYPRKQRKPVVNAVAHVQDVLGEINDHAVALARYRRWLANVLYLDKGLTKEVLFERDTLRQRIDNFAKWWTPRREAKLKGSIEQLTGA